MAPLWSGADSAVEGSLRNWVGFISPGIPYLGIVRGKFPPDFAFYIRHLGKTILLHLQAPESCRDSKFSHFHEPRILPDLWASQLRQRKQRPKIFVSFNRARKSTLLLRPGTVVGADCVRSIMSLQTLIKNVQELAKEEGEESETKLREAIEILEGGHLRHCRRLARLLGRFFRSTDIGFWIRVRSKVASASGSQFRCYCLFLFLIASAKRTDSITARVRLWIYYPHQPSPFYS